MINVESKKVVEEAVETEIYGISKAIAETEIPIQLHNCWQQELNKGKGGFVITVDDLDKAGNRDWAQISLSFPEITLEGEIRVRVGLTIIQGENCKVKTEYGVVNSFEALVPDPALKGTNKNRQIRIRTNYMLLRDLLADAEFTVEEQKRIVNWAKNRINGLSSNVSLSIVPKTEDAVFAFNLKLNYHPDSKQLAVKTPVGINNFYLTGFGLLPTSVMSQFNGEFKINRSTPAVSTRLDEDDMNRAVIEDVIGVETKAESTADEAMEEANELTI